MEAVVRYLKTFAASEPFKSATSDLIHGVPRRVATKRLVAMEGETVTYIVDPKEKKNKSEKSETIGWREIISVILVTPDISGLFLMVFHKADYFGGFGHLRMDFGSLAQRKGKDPVS